MDVTRSSQQTRISTSTAKSRGTLSRSSSSSALAASTPPTAHTDGRGSPSKDRSRPHTPEPAENRSWAEPKERSIEQLRTHLESYKFQSPVSTPSPRKRRRRDSEDSDELVERSPCEAELPAVSASQESPRKKSRKKPSRPYAPPEKYEHLHMLPDYLEMGLDVVFCGINPGYTSAEIGHHYAHSTNHFWLGLHESGLTDVLVPPEEDYTLPAKYNFGLTNLVDRPTAEQSELGADEMRQSVPALMTKLARYRPRIVCFLSKGIWEVFLREAYRLASPHTPASPATGPVQTQPISLSTSPGCTKPVKSKFFDIGSPPGSHDPSDLMSLENQPPPTPRKRSPTKVPKHTFEWGLQPFKIGHRLVGTTSSVKETLLFVVPSPSARVVAYQWWDKVAFFRRLHDLVREVQAGSVDTSEFHILPLTTTKSIYFMDM